MGKMRNFRNVVGKLRFLLAGTVEGLCSVLTLALCLAPLSSRAADEPTGDEAPPPDEMEIILERIQRDILYGSDDFFGEDTDLSYADGVQLIERVVETLPAGTPVASSENQRSGGSGETSSGGTGGGGTGGGGTVEPPGGGEEPPGGGGEEPPPI